MLSYRPYFGEVIAVNGLHDLLKQALETFTGLLPDQLLETQFAP